MWNSPNYTSNVMYSNVSVAPASEPISLTEAKTHLRVDQTAEDSMISILIQAAREIAEERTNRSFISQTRVMKLDYFPRCGFLTLPNGPIISLTSIDYSDSNDDPQTVPTADYWTDFSSNISRVVPVDSWPDVYQKPNCITVTYVAGFGADATSVPAAIKQAIQLIVGHLYQNREQVVISNSGVSAIEIPFGAEILLGPHVLEQSVIY